jgi:hypothetical protein
MSVVARLRSAAPSGLYVSYARKAASCREVVGLGPPTAQTGGRRPQARKVTTSIGDGLPPVFGDFHSEHCLFPTVNHQARIAHEPLKRSPLFVAQPGHFSPITAVGSRLLP